MDTSQTITTILQEIDKTTNITSLRACFKKFAKSYYTKIDEQNAKIKELESQIVTITGQLVDVSTTNTKLTISHQDLIEKFAIVNEKLCHVQSPHDHNDNEAILTAQEIERKRSVVILNVPEPNEDRVTECNRIDNDKINSLINDLKVEANVNKCFRMGTKSAGRHRPIKVVLCSSSQQKQLVSAYRKSPVNGIYLRPSYSKEKLRDISIKRQQIAELKKNNPDIRFVLYRDQICTSSGDVNQKPKVFTGKLPSVSSPPSSP